MECYKIFSEISSALATLVAAFAGAWFAFHFQENKELLKKHKERVSLINQALIALIRQYQALENIKLELEPFKDDPIRHIRAPGVTTNQFSDIKIKVETLSFLIDSPEPTLLIKIMLEQERFEMALKAVELRSQRHVSDLQPKYAALAIPDGSLVNIGDLRTQLGDFLFEACKNETNQMYEAVYSCADSTVAAINNLFNYAKLVYPKEKL